MVKSRYQSKTKNPRHDKGNILAFLIFLMAFTFSLPFQANAQWFFDGHNDTIITIHATVTDYSSKRRLQGVHVINLSLNRATITNAAGLLRIEARHQDTLYLSHIGFKKRLYRLDLIARDTAKRFNITLYEDTVILKKYVLLGATRQAKFKSDFINRPFIPDTLNTAFKAFIEENHFKAPTTGGIVLPGPATLIYEHFNKEARLQRRIEKNRARYYDQLPEEEKKKVLFD